MLLSNRNPSPDSLSNDHCYLVFCIQVGDCRGKIVGIGELVGTKVCTARVKPLHYDLGAGHCFPHVIQHRLKPEPTKISNSALIAPQTIFPIKASNAFFLDYNLSTEQCRFL